RRSTDLDRHEPVLPVSGDQHLRVERYDADDLVIDPGSTPKVDLFGRDVRLRTPFALAHGGIRGGDTGRRFMTGAIDLPEHREQQDANNHHLDDGADMMLFPARSPVHVSLPGSPDKEGDTRRLAVYPQVCLEMHLDPHAHLGEREDRVDVAGRERHAPTG